MCLTDPEVITGRRNQGRMKYFAAVPEMWSSFQTSRQSLCVFWIISLHKNIQIAQKSVAASHKKTFKKATWPVSCLEYSQHTFYIEKQAITHWTSCDRFVIDTRHALGPSWWNLYLMLLHNSEHVSHLSQVLHTQEGVIGAEPEVACCCCNFGALWFLFGGLLVYIQWSWQHYCNDSLLHLCVCVSLPVENCLIVVQVDEQSSLIMQLQCCCYDAATKPQKDLH